MCKKLFVTTLAILVAVAVVKRTWVGSHICAWWNRTCERVKRSVDPETEIARLEFELKSLSEQEELYIDKIARQKVELNKRSAALKEKKEQRAALQHRGSSLRTALAQAGDSQAVSYNGKTYTPAEAEEQVNFDLDDYDRLDKEIVSEDRYLTVLQKGTQQNREKLSSIRRFRLDGLTRLLDLRRELAQVRQAKMVDVSLVRDDKARRLDQDIQRLEDQLKVEREKLHLRGNDRGPIETAEKARAREEARQKRKDAVFPVRPVVSK